MTHCSNCKKEIRSTATRCISCRSWLESTSAIYKKKYKRAIIFARIFCVMPLLSITFLGLWLSLPVEAFMRLAESAGARVVILMLVTRGLSRGCQKRGRKPFLVWMIPMILLIFMALGALGRFVAQVM